jgi:general secretion pathway protein H
MTPTSRVEQSGFTLLELLVVLSIIVLGAGLLLPSLSLSDNSSFNAEVRKAAATLSYARRLAIVQGRPVTAQLQVGPEQQAAPDRDQQYQYWHSEQLELQYQDDLYSTPASVNSLPVTFYPQGGSTGGTLHFAREQRRAFINVNPVTGRIRVSWSGEELDDDEG